MTEKIYGRMPPSNSVLTSAVIGVIALILAVLIEITAYLIIQIGGMNFYLPLELSNSPNSLDIEKVRGTFSYELGWEFPQPNPHGYRGEKKNIGKAVLAVFGDSYTWAHPDIENSWPHLLEMRLGRPVLNFGVVAYGTDQAYLRFRQRYIDKLETPYVALLVMSENIARTVNRYRGFYMRKRGLRATKPRYITDPDGKIRFLPNPVRTAEEMSKLWDTTFLAEIGQQDYWYHFFDKYDLNHKVGFPYSYYLLKALPFYLKRGYRQRIQNHKDYEHLYDSEEATAILTFIIESFIADARIVGAQPIIYFLPNWKDLVDHQERGKTIYSDYIQNLRTEHSIEVNDALDYFAPLLHDGDEVSEFFISRLDGHYNPKGEQVIADGLFRQLIELERDHNALQL